MKKTITSFVALLLMAATAQADGLVVRNVLIQQGGTATVQVELNNTENSYRAVLFDLTLPDGLTVAYDEYGDVQFTKGARLSAKYSVTGNHLEGGSDRFGIINTTDDEAIAGEEGTLFSFTIAASTEPTPGSVLTATISNIKLTDSAATDHVQEAFTFNITVEEQRTVLDETSTIMPEASDGTVDVRLNRTIKGGEWNTLVLPFNATAEQMKAAFGSDTQLAAFTAWASEEDNDGAIVSIDVSFATVTEIEANKPILIKTSADYTSTTFNGVTITPEEEPTVQVGRKSSERGYFYGTYVPTKVPEENLFLSGNQFWYSTGQTNIKGYRGYFEFRDVLDAYYEAGNVKVNFLLDGTATQIHEMTNDKSRMTNGECFDLSGRRVTEPQKGIYIMNGSKVVVK